MTHMYEYSLEWDYLLGKTLIEITPYKFEQSYTSWDNDDLIFFELKDSENNTYIIEGDLECCQEFTIDICGDLQDLLHTPILHVNATEETNIEKLEDFSHFYHVSTIKGTVTIAARGNSCYSERLLLYKDYRHLKK